MQRTILQNSSYWKAVTVLAERLNDAGYTLSAAIEKGLLIDEIPWTPENITDIATRKIMISLWPEGPERGEWRNPERPSTTELNTREIKEVFDVLTRAMAQKFGVTVDWPDRFNGGNI